MKEIEKDLKIISSYTKNMAYSINFKTNNYSQFLYILSEGISWQEYGKNNRKAVIANYNDNKDYNRKIKDIIKWNGMENVKQEIENLKFEIEEFILDRI